jgi:hypothetical protein
MKIEGEALNRVQKRMNELWPQGKAAQCAVCAHSNWTLNDTVFEMREFHGPQTIIGSGAIFPVVALSRNNCGNTHLLSAIRLGAVAVDAGQQQETGKNE